MSTSESVAAPRAGERDANGERLMSWLRAQGGTLGALEVRRYADGQRGVHATADIARGTEVVRVPHASLMTRELARTSPLGARIAAGRRRPRNAHTWLAAFLLEARRAPDSFFRPYFESLPASVPNVAVCLRDEEIALLRGSFLREQIEQRRIELASEYRQLCRAVPGFDSFSARDFIAARLLVGSRAFGVSIAGRRTEALVPFADLLNHHPTPDVHWSYDDAGRALTMTAVRDVPTGSAVHDSYGQKPNARLFMTYGFCLEASARDEAVLSFPDPAGERDHAPGVALGGQRRFTVTTADDDAARGMMSFLCAASASTGARRGPPATDVETLTVSEQRAVWAALAQACRTALSAFETTYAEDQALLAEGHLPRRARDCVRARSHEKRVLHHYLDLATFRDGKLAS